MPPPSQTGVPAHETGERVVEVGKMLASAGDSFLAALRTPVRTSSDLVKAAGVNKDVAGRFLTALGKRDPLAVVYYMPGVESLRRLSRGAKSRAANPAAIRIFDDAVSAFEQFLQGELGGRHALDSMASAWLPEARERFEATSRQMAFRSMANLRGVECETSLNAALIHPGDDPDRYDSVDLQGLIGVRRLRPSVPLNIAMFQHWGDTAGRPALTVDGRKVEEGGADELLRDFGRGDPLALRAMRHGSTTVYQLVGGALGAGTASDVYFGQYSPGLFRRWATRPDDIAAHMESTEVPTQRAVIDVLLHRDVWPGLEPDLMLYNTCVRGVALPYDRSRDIDRLDMLDTVRYLGQGVDCCRVAEVPRYIELLEWTCKQRGWDPGSFRVYRCDARYPVFGVQYAMAFHLQPRPGS